MTRASQWSKAAALAVLVLTAGAGCIGCGSSGGSPQTAPPPEPGPGPDPTPDPNPDPGPTPGDSPTATNHDITVGPGFTDVSPHQLVRTHSNVLYLVLPTCFAFHPDCGDNEVKVYRADRAGTPSAFDEKDGAHAPGGGISATAIAIDGDDQIHALWNDRGGAVRYARFDTRSDRWGPSEVVDTTNWTDFTQGDEGVALALDASGAPHAVWSVRGEDRRLHLRYAHRGDGSWHDHHDVDDVIDCDPASDECSAWHPAIAFTANQTLIVSWLNGTGAYTHDGTIRVRRRDPAGSWGPSIRIDDHAESGLDNGPSLLVTPNGVVHLTFCENRANAIRYWYDDGRGFRGDRQPPTQATHDPSLGPDRDGGVYIYGHGTPTPSIADHGDDLFFFHKPAGGEWSAFTHYVAGSYDSSVTTRWSQFFHFHPEQVDIGYWSDSYPNVAHMGVN